MPAFKNIANKKFGKLKAIKRVFGNFKRSTWQCQCDCGNIKNVSGTSLVSGNTKSCGCYRKLTPSKTRSLNPKNSSINALYSSYKGGAFKRKLDFKISIDEFKNLIFNNCYYCGQPPDRVYSIYFKVDGTPSRTPQQLATDDFYKNTIITVNGIDRVNNNLGYILQNAQSCCYDCNIAKHEKTEEQFLEWANRLIIYQKGKNDKNNRS